MILIDGYSFKSWAQNEREHNILRHRMQRSQHHTAVWFSNSSRLICCLIPRKSIICEFYIGIRWYQSKIHFLFRAPSTVLVRVTRVIPYVLRLSIYASIQCFDWLWWHTKIKHYFKMHFSFTYAGKVYCKLCEFSYYFYS